MGYQDVTSRKAVIQAIEECDAFGRERFRERYNFEESRSYYLRFRGREYDSKPILAVAHMYLFPEKGPLKNDFSGGKTHAARHLVRLGFEVDGMQPGADDWTVDEVETVVERYFDLYRRARSGENLNKSAHNRETVALLPTRNKGAVGRKYANISSALARLELPWASGIRPLHNSQLLLEAVVNDWVEDHPDFFSRVPLRKLPTPTVVKDVEVDSPTAKQLMDLREARRAVRVNFAERDERNRNLGRSGEEWAVAYLKEELRQAGRTDLAEAVRWVSDADGDGLGYDVVSFAPDGEFAYVEVKTTNGGISSPFLITRNEVAASQSLPGYVLMRVFDFGRAPQFYRLKGDLQLCCKLEPQVFRALPSKCGR